MCVCASVCACQQLLIQLTGTELRDIQPSPGIYHPARPPRASRPVCVCVWLCVSVCVYVCVGVYCTSCVSSLQLSCLTDSGYDIRVCVCVCVNKEKDTMTAPDALRVYIKNSTERSRSLCSKSPIPQCTAGGQNCPWSPGHIRRMTCFSGTLRCSDEVGERERERTRNRIPCMNMNVILSPACISEHTLMTAEHRHAYQ